VYLCPFFVETRRLFCVNNGVNLPDNIGVRKNSHIRTAFFGQFTSKSCAYYI